MDTQLSENKKYPEYPPHPRRVPAVPDLRFEHSYLRSIAPYVHVDRRPSSQSVQDIKGKAKEVAPVHGEDTAVSMIAGEAITVQWGRILWITTRDQVISPFLQGALWGVASHYLRPALSIFARWWAKGNSKSSSKVDGGGVEWLKQWAGSLRAENAGTGVRANLALQK